ncbi:MAG: CRISPR-associated endonuclease Cas1 [Nitrospirae bacterium]|nr:CRISPR-associated endonuclease Cas1 [Nitrospirota bacterium]
MANIYLTEQGSVVGKTGNRLIVRKDDVVLLDVPCDKIDSVLIFGNVQVTTQAVHEMFEHGIELAMRYSGGIPRLG